MDRRDIQDARALVSAQAIASGRTALGVEFGSTRIKAVLINEDSTPIASGSYAWENRFEHGVWTYHLEDVWTGLQESYRELSNEIREKYCVQLGTVSAIGFSAMMHGYLALDEDGTALTPFRTWRNTMTAQAAEKLTDLFHFNIPQRWSIAHLYQAILNGESHVRDIRYLTTLAGYVHWKLSGQKVLCVGEASGMFPIDSTTNDYDERMLALFNEQLEGQKLPWKLQDILPQVLVAGKNAEAAVKAAVMTEHVAASVWLALQLGTPDDIPAEDVARLHARYTTVYGQSADRRYKE